MTGAVDRRRRPRPAVEQRWRFQRGWLCAALTVAGLACGSACTSDGTEGGKPAPPPVAQASSPAVPDTDAQAIRSTIETMNASAAAGVAQQQATLAGVVEPALATALDDCAPATTTLHFEPIYGGLRPAPGWAPADGSLTGTVYALPTLIRVYTGDRITGTDLTTLHFGVQSGAAYLTPLCVG